MSKSTSTEVKTAKTSKEKEIQKEFIMKEIKLAVTAEELQLIVNALEIVSPDSESSCTLRDNLLTSFQNKLAE